MKSPVNMRKRKQAVSIPREERTLWWVVLVVFEMAAYLVFAGLIAIGLYFGYQQISNKAVFPLRRIILAEPLRYGAEQDVKSVVINNAGRDLLKVNVRDLADKLNAIAWVNQASVEKYWPDALYVKIHERYPVVKWSNGGYLDKDGHRFDLSHASSESLFQVSGPEGYEQRVLSRYRIFEPWLLAQQIPMSYIRLDDRLVWHIGLPSDIDVILGRNDLNQRLKKLAVVYRRVIKKYRQYIQSVDLRYQDGFSVRWKAGFQPVSSNDNVRK